MNVKNIFLLVRLAVCILVLQANLALLLSGYTTTSSYLQAVTGGTSYFKDQ